MTNKKVVHIYWSLGIGGIETMLVNIANAQANLSTQVDVVLINDLAEPSLLKAFAPNVNVHIIGRKVGSKSPLFILRLNRILRKLNPDAIHLHASALYSLILSRRLRRVASVTLHDLPSGKVRRENFLLRHCHILDVFMAGNTASIDRIPKVFSISNAVAHELKSKYNVESSVICNGILTERFKRKDFSVLSYSPSTLRLVQVSRLEHDKKGQDLLIEAAAKIPYVDVTFIGEGRSLEYLRSLTEELGVADRIHFLGNQNQSYIAEHLCDFDLFVQPSRYEGFGLTVAEAMAAKVPALVSFGQGPAEVTENNKFGWTFKNGDVEDLAKTIRQIHANYSEAIDKANNACEHVCRNYDVVVTAKKYLDHYCP